MTRDPKKSALERSQSYDTIEVRPIAPALGAEISGVDLSKSLEPAVVEELHRAWLEFEVIFFHDQELTPSQQLRFAKQFGEPLEYPFVRGLEEHPEIVPVVKLEHETVNFGGIWHSDTTYLECPPKASLLYAREVPPVGGDTLFASMTLAYETLSKGLQEMLAPLWALNVADKAETSATRADRIAERPQEGAEATRSAEHPVVRTHPETGRRALYVNTAHTLRFRDMTEEESAPLLEYLYAHQINPEHRCRFTWRKGSLAFWDNRSTQHYPVNDYHGYRREMHRITLAGDPPR